MQIAVIGATGHGGKSLIKLLISEGHHIIALSRNKIIQALVHLIIMNASMRRVKKIK